MEHDENDFLEELMALSRDNCDTFPSEMSDFFAREENFDYCFEGNLNNVWVPEPPLYCPSKVCSSHGTEFSNVMPEIQSSSAEVLQRVGDEEVPSVEFNNVWVPEPPLYCPSKVYSSHGTEFSNVMPEIQSSSAGVLQRVGDEEVPSIEFEANAEREKEKKAKRMSSRNLIAERRRRKRLTDRLLMLRSVIPRNSKTGRTSIPLNAVEYIKELKGRIKKLQHEIQIEVDPENRNLVNMLKESNPNEILGTNSTKIDVERQSGKIRIEICCAGRPGMPQSVVSTLEALGLEIENSVMTCFDGFKMRATCSEGLERTAVNSEEVKQALLRNLGYEGRSV